MVRRAPGRDPVGQGLPLRAPLPARAGGRRRRAPASLHLRLRDRRRPARGGRRARARRAWARTTPTATSRTPTRARSRCPDWWDGSSSRRGTACRWGSAVDLGLDGKVVLVTGAASGIGRATAKAFAARARRWRSSTATPKACASAREEIVAPAARTTHVVDVSRQHRGRRRPRRGRRRARPHRRGVQQRRRDRARRLAARHPGGVVGPRHRRQPQGRLAVHARPAAPHVRPPRRRDRQHLVRRRPGRRARHEPVHDGQARRDRADAHRGARVRDVRHPRQRRRPRHRRRRR